MCTKWFLGTGGGDGRITMFENWDADKFKRYNISKDSYDHHDVGARPSILIDNYHKHKHPYLTMIHLWDEKKSFILSSKYDPLNAGKGEAGMPRDDSTLSSLSNSSTSRRSQQTRSKSKDKGDGVSIRDTMREMIDLMTAVEKSPEKAKRDDMGSNTSSNLPMSMDGLYKLYDKHMNHLNFLKENGLFTGNRKSEVLENIEDVYGQINSASGGKRVRDEEDDTSLDRNSNSNVS